MASLTERLVRSIRVEQSVVSHESSRSLLHTLGLPSLCLFLTHIHKLIPHISRSVFWGQFCKSSKLRVTWVRYVNFVKWTKVPNLLNHFRIRHVKIRRINALHCYFESFFFSSSHGIFPLYDSLLTKSRLLRPYVSPKTAFLQGPEKVDLTKIFRPDVSISWADCDKFCDALKIWEIL